MSTITAASITTTGTHTFTTATTYLLQYLPSSPNGFSGLGVPSPFSQGIYQCRTPGDASYCTAAVGFGDGAVGTPTCCTAAVAYGGGPRALCGQGYSGLLVADTLTLGGVSATVSIVAITAIQNGFQEPPAAGIMGIAFPSLNNNCGGFSACDTSHATKQPVAIDLLLAARGLPNEFSLCMGSPTSAGRFVLGGADPSFYTGAFQNVTVDSSSGFYSVSVSSVSIGVNRAPLEGITLSQQASAFANAAPIVDSGTPYLQLPNEIYNAVNNPVCTTDADCDVNLHMAGGTVLTAPGLMTCSADGGGGSGWCSRFNNYATSGGAIIG
jgi:hypothetical protein